MSEVFLRSIISNRKLCLNELPSERLLWGEFRLPRDPQHDGDWLVPSYGGSNVSLSVGSQTYSGTFPRATLPADSDVESLLSLGAHLAKLVDSGEPGDKWLATPPSEPNISESAKLLPLEETLIDEVSALEAVFARPRSDIETMDESVFISRARRPSKRAPAYLSAHTEDWERVGLKGVIPRKILSRMRVENLAIYENCMMVRLADNLVWSISRKIERLKKILRDHEESCDMGDDLIGTRFRQNRIAEIWGILFKENTGGEWIRENLEKLQTVYFRLLGLRNYPLYTTIPQETTVPRDLKNSNILNNDPLYRKGAELWLAWSKKEREAELTAEEQVERQQRVCESMEHFAVLLCLHSLEILYPWIRNHLQEHKIQRGMSVEVSDGNCRFTLEWKTERSLSIRYCEQELRIVSLPANLSGVVSQGDAQNLVQSFAGESHDRKKWTLVLHLEDGGMETVSSRWLNSAGNDAESEVSLPLNLMVFGVSPLSIGSAEKVGRALRWFFAMADLEHYPHQFEVPGKADFLAKALKEGWLKRNALNQYSVCDLPSEDDPLAQAASQEHANVVQLNKQLQEVASKRTSRDGERYSNGNKSAGKHLKQELDKAKSTLKAISHATGQIVRGIQIIRLIKRCPVCHKCQESIEFKQRDDGCYACRCASCETTWEARIDQSGKRYPVLTPGGTLVDSKGRSVDRLYGADILALPDGDSGFMSPPTFPQC